MLCMLKMSKMVFAAFMQHCIQSTVTHFVTHVKGVKYYVLYSEEAALLTFLDLSTTRMIASKMHSQSPILKTKGALSNPVILRH